MNRFESKAVRIILALAFAALCSSRAFALEVADAGTRAQIVAQFDADAFGDLTEGSFEVDAEEARKVRQSASYKKAYEVAKQRYCTEGRIQFSFTWEGEIEVHGCGDIENRCYHDFKVMPPGSTWKCTGGICKCLESGDIQVIRPAATQPGRR